MMLTSDTEEPSPQNSNEKKHQKKIQALTFVSSSQVSFHDKSATTSLNDSQLKSPVKDVFVFGCHIKRDDSDLVKSPFASSEQMTRSTSKYYEDEYLTGSEGEFDQQSQPFKKITLEKFPQDSVKIEAKEENTSEEADSEVSKDDEELNDSEGESLKAEIEVEEVNGGTNYFLEYENAKMENISSLQKVSGCQDQIDKHAKGFNDLEAYPVKEEYFMLGEKNQPNYEDLGNGIDEIDEINENPYQDQSQIDQTNHRKVASINPIYLCQEKRLQFKVDSLNTNGDAMQSGYGEQVDSDDDQAKTVENLKKNHRKLQESRIQTNVTYHRSCINL